MISRLHSVRGVSVTGSEYRYGPAAGGGVRFGRGLGSKSFKMVALDEIEAGPIRMYTPAGLLNQHLRYQRRYVG